MQSGELAPITVPPSSDGLKFMQQSPALLVGGLYSGVVTERVTDIYGPYTPANIPIWVYKMMQRDGVIALALRALKAPMLSASRYYLEGSTAEARAFHWAWLSPLLPKLLRTVLDCFDFGFSAHEIVFDETLPTVRFEVEGVAKQLRRAIVPRKFVDLDPGLTEILVDRKTRMFRGVALSNNLADGSVLGGIDPLEPEVFIPAHKVLLASCEPKFQNYRGYALQQPAYNPWWWGNVAEHFWARWMERLAGGVYVGTAPSDTRVNADGQRVNPVEYMQSLLIALRSMGTVAIPWEADPATRENKWKIELLESKSDGEAFSKWLVHLTASKTRAALIPDRLIIQDGTGSFAAHESSFEQFFTFLESILAESVFGPINTQVLAPVHAYNYGSVSPAPRLAATPMNPAMRKLFMEVLKLVAPMPRALRGDKKITNGGLVDALTLLKQIGVATLPEKEWPWVDRQEDVGVGATPKKRDVTATDTEKNGDKNPIDERE